MRLYLILELVLFVVAIMTLVRIFRASVVDGILSMFVPLYVLVPAYKYRNDPDHDVRIHVAVLFIGGALAAWLGYQVAKQYQAEIAQMQAEQEASATAPASQAFVDDANEDDTNTTNPTATIEIGPAQRRARERADRLTAAITPKSDVRTAPPAPTSHEPDTPATASAAPQTLTLRQALATVTFRRGTFQRESIGFAIDVPPRFHLLAGSDVRRVEEAQHVAADPREIAWVVHEAVKLDGANAWHVSVRWLNDGWIGAGTLDAAALLAQAQRNAATSHLATSGGDLIGFAVAPSYSDGVADWVEERLPANASASALDCHALHLSRKGAIEFSVIGAPAGSQALCDASVRALARSTRMEADYSPAAGADTAHAPYALADLVTGAH